MTQSNDELKNLVGQRLRQKDRQRQQRSDPAQRENQPQPSLGPRQPGGGYRFLNPYNFVRLLEVKNPQAAPLLGRCTPPPHDRYLGLTGRVTCRLTAKTPIFVSDSHGI